MFHVKHIPGDALESLAALGVAAEPDTLVRLGRFTDLLEEALRGKRFGNLLGPGEMPRVWSRHILESAAYLPFLREGARVVDVGSGAGFPGVVLAILGRSVTLLESRRKRFLFLLRVRETMGLQGLRIINGRVEDSGPFPEGTVFTARAVERMSELPAALALAAPFGYSLTVRAGNPESLPRYDLIAELPSPPLDRPGFMVQFRHPGTGTKEESVGG